MRCGVLLLALVWTNAVAGARAAASSPTPVVLVQHAADLAAPAPPLDGIAAQVLGGSRAAAHAFFGEAFERRPRLWRAADRGAAGKAFAARAGAMLPLEHIAGALHANVSATGKLGAPPQPLVYGMGGDLMLARAHAGETQMLGNFWSHSGKAVSAEVVDAALANGFSIVFNQMHTRSGALAEAAGALAAHLGAFVGVNVYVTPAGMADAPDEDELSTSARAVGATAAARQGFGLHFDEMESFVVQLSGTKHWQVYGSVLGLPRPNQRVLPSRQEAGFPTMEVELGPGDVLYLPRGWAHEARTLGSNSIHATLGANVQEATYAHLAAETVRAAEAGARRALEASQLKGGSRGWGWGRRAAPAGEGAAAPSAADVAAAQTLTRAVEGASSLTYADLAVAAVWAAANETAEPLRRSAPVSAALEAHLVESSGGSYSMRALLERSLEVVRARAASGGLRWLAEHVLARNVRSLLPAKGRTAAAMGADPQTAAAKYQLWAQQALMSGGPRAGDERSLALVAALSAVSTEREFDAAAAALRAAVQERVDYNARHAAEVRERHAPHVSVDGELR